MFAGRCDCRTVPNQQRFGAQDALLPTLMIAGSSGIGGGAACGGALGSNVRFLTSEARNTMKLLQMSAQEGRYHTRLKILTRILLRSAVFRALDHLYGPLCLVSGLSENTGIVSATRPMSSFILLSCSPPESETVASVVLTAGVDEVFSFYWLSIRSELTAPHPRACQCSVCRSCSSG